MVFYVSIGLLRESGMWLLTSLSVSTVSGLELIIPSVFANSVLKFSLFKLHQYVLSRHHVLSWQSKFGASKLLPYMKQYVDYFPK